MLQRFTIQLSIVALLSVGFCRDASAGLFNTPRLLQSQVKRISLDSPVLGPMAHARFCVEYPADCRVQKMAFRGGAIQLTERRWGDLVDINLKVNREILPERNSLGLSGEKWVIAPASGDCNDYAVTKRHELIGKGWPSRSLLLAEVEVSGGEHHVVVIVRTAQGDFVLDNLRQTVTVWSQLPYRWIRTQRPSNPRYWSTVKNADA
jgi:predicted transglutaminase-like cysteine proteinase